MSTTGLPFDDIRDLIARMPGPDDAAVGVAREREAQLTKPAGSLGRLEELSQWLAAWQGGVPHVDRPLVAVFAGNHGVTAKGVSPFPPEVTAQMVENFAAGGAAINQICATYDLGLKVYDLALELPTGDITEEQAMDERTCAGTMAFGMEVLMDSPDLLCIGEMGIGNTTIAAAIFAALFGGEGADWAGAGTGLDAEGLSRKAAVIDQALATHKDHLDDPLEVLRRLGGREVAAMAGAILGARHQRVPVIVDGFVATAAAAILHALDKRALDHCLFGHVSAEQGHLHALEAMGKVPLLALGMRLGEGTGAALAAGIVRAAARCHRDMATFAQAAVSNRDPG
ncbi:nicotinate-nucleotide--dimethylbenzimidazole phosphoribosyltransferase [Jiella marina]|uniref:nicotinate-nucleotide--dimethylbenzimidazole phosphoribosyltransferase n=1 Tax=Jiella sp. LLJ827 TaxID=2917712 RepID=UPI0021012E5A|nr:nicotinate-nucleotide--dimethylbenzimidazole phosphoribosyltransferase [Jiella sp. LLJ827]MCQ0987728.1 nicotinate-nucleotide--dimethylbenzimidazole phosphoribosyltransferase [Jiella sp. LLJ827]